MSNKLKIEALRKAADLIEVDPNKYYWGHYGSCNCGFLVQATLDLTSREIRYEIEEMSHSYDETDMNRFCWSSKVEYCSSTGLAMPLIVTKMMEMGFSVEDFTKLEWLGLPEEERDSTKMNSYSRSDKAIEFMRKWADELEREELNQIFISRNRELETVKVSV